MPVSLGILLAFFLFTSPSPARSQIEQKNFHETEELARQLGGKLSEAENRTVLVMDLRTPEGQWLPFGAWLADQFSASLGKLGLQIEVIDRVKLTAALSAQHLSATDEFEFGTAINLGKSVGAHAVVFGSYGAAEHGIGVTLVAFRVPEAGNTESKPTMLAASRGKIDLTQDLAAHLDVPLDSLRPGDGVAQAGLGGVTIPTCIKCIPPPRMSVPDIDLIGFLRDKRGVATLQLRFIVTAAGRTTAITVSQPLGYGFDEQYLKAAKDFEFTPAVDADNKPVPVHTFLDFSITMK
jgi:hypothetical protein